MFIKFWGTRGSVPVPGKDTIKYGGNTPCVEIRTADNKLLILDAGTGIRGLGNNLVQNGSNGHLDILLTHYHWDHIQGIPFFIPIYQKGRDITFYGIPGRENAMKKLLSDQMELDYFPVKINEVPANIKFEHIQPNKEFHLDGLKIETFSVYHPSPTLTFKITENKKNIIYMTDNELDVRGENDTNISEKVKIKNKELINFCNNCDYLIHDMMYDEKVIESKLGWGHSSNKALANFAILANVKNLVFFHYNPDYSDEKIDQLLESTQEELKKNGSDINCIASREGLTITL